MISMRIFITGGTGFIGSHVVRKLKEEGHDLLLLEESNENLSEIEKWFDKVKNFKPDVTIHLAWEGIPDYSSEMSVRNLKYGLELIHKIAKIGCKKFISTGSCWEYGNQKGELNEEDKLKQFNPFSAAKKSLYLLGSEIANEYNMKFIWLRLFYVYGPGQRSESLIPYIINSIRNGKNPEIKTLNAKNDFVYVEDVADVICAAAKNNLSSGVYNVGSGKSTKVKEILDIISRYYSIEVLPDLSKEDEINFWADISKIKKEIGWEPKFSISEGIKKFIETI